MLSRTANHLYWMARYIERAENMARILDVTASMALIQSESMSEADLWQPALEISGNVEHFEAHYKELTASNCNPLFGHGPRKSIEYLFCPAKCT